MNYIKPKSFCTAKETIDKIDNLLNRRRYLQTIYPKGLISQINKDSYNSTSKRYISDLIKN